MNSYSFSQLVNFVNQNVFLFAFTNNATTLREYISKHSPKNEFLQKLVFRFSDTVMTEKQKNDAIDCQSFLNGDTLPSLKNGSLQLVYNAFYKNHILVVNNHFAVMCNPSVLTNENEKTAYNQTLVNMFLFLASPNTIQHESKQIAKTLSIVTPYPYGKTFINSLKYMSSDIQNEFNALNDSFTPCKNETVFFSFTPKVETKTTAKVEKTPKVETVIASPVSSPVSSPKLKAVEKMQILYDREKQRISLLPKNKSSITAVKKFDTFTVETWCKFAHENSSLKTATFATWLNTEISKNA